jgi:hypothetical protein
MLVNLFLSEPLRGDELLAEEEVFLPTRSASPERLFRSVGLVKSDLWGSLLDTTLIDVMWAKHKHPKINLEERKRKSTITQTYTQCTTTVTDTVT